MKLEIISDNKFTPLSNDLIMNYIVDLTGYSKEYKKLKKLTDLQLSHIILPSEKKKLKKVLDIYMEVFLDSIITFFECYRTLQN